MKSVWPPIECSARARAKFDLDGEGKPPIETCAEQRKEFLPTLLSQLSLGDLRQRQESYLCIARGITKTGQIYLLIRRMHGIFSSDLRLDIGERHD